MALASGPCCQGAMAANPSEFHSAWMGAWALHKRWRVSKCFCGVTRPCGGIRLITNDAIHQPQETYHAETSNPHRRYQSHCPLLDRLHSCSCRGNSGCSGRFGGAGYLSRPLVPQAVLAGSAAGKVSDNTAFAPSTHAGRFFPAGVWRLVPTSLGCGTIYAPGVAL